MQSNFIARNRVSHLKSQLPRAISRRLRGVVQRAVALAETRRRVVAFHAEEHRLEPQFGAKSSMRVVTTPSGNWQPPPSRLSNARSAVTASHVGASLMAASARRVSASSARTCKPMAPCPTAGNITAGPNAAAANRSALRRFDEPGAELFGVTEPFQPGPREDQARPIVVVAQFLQPRADVAAHLAHPQIGPVPAQLTLPPQAARGDHCARRQRRQRAL